VADVGYDEANAILEVGYRSGRTYRWEAITAAQYQALMQSSSIGSFIYRNLGPGVEVFD